MRVSVLGAGSFGTALAKLLCENGHEVRLWCRRTEHASEICARHENTLYLPGIPLPVTLQATADCNEAVRGAEMVVVAVPSHVVRKVMESTRAHLAEGAWVVSAVKGVEEESLLRMSQVLEEVLGTSYAHRIAVLSGPSFAKEVAAGKPTAVTTASRNLAAAKATQAAFQGSTFRVYTHDDVIGVELGGATKNVIAIAAGVSDGLGLGHSSRAALITRGVAEIARLVVRLGGSAQTVSGLSGVGDLVLTCTGDLSRNRSLGLRLGRGEPLEAILSSMHEVAEGVRNSISISELARKAGVEMPITEQVRLLLHEGKSALQVLNDLLRREAKPEFWS
ncbi:MAG: NAD(P)-dependent glycerol-3-phosphate dehydrogenase [Candidatus Binatia bacterium]|nr:NAD(P)-dependent glycerol-3-phosphate dehydrogenase [Candidatus Binatia bacterium]